MKETGIIMSGDHPSKCLDGTKTMTRRTWGLELINKDPDRWELSMQNELGLWVFTDKHSDGHIVLKCPYGGVGDILIMRETWRPAWKATPYFSAGGVQYKDGGEILARVGVLADMGYLSPEEVEEKVREERERIFKVYASPERRL